MIDIAEDIEKVQALWASVVGVSPLPNVPVDRSTEVGFFTGYAIFKSAFTKLFTSSAKVFTSCEKVIMTVTKIFTSFAKLIISFAK